MKNFSLVLNVLLLAAVGYLYYHSFSGKKSTSTSQVAKSSVEAAGPEVCRIAYFNMDSLENNFEYYKTRKSDFENRREKGNQDLDLMQKNYNARYMQLQQQVTNQADQEKAAQELAGMQQKMQDAKTKLDNELYKIANNLNEDILAKINDYLKVYNKPKKYDYILQNEARLIYYKDSTLNITTEMIKGLNDMYKKTKN